MTPRRVTISIPEDVYHIVEESRAGRSFSQALSDLIKSGAERREEIIPSMKRSYSEEIEGLKRELQTLYENLPIIISPIVKDQIAQSMIISPPHDVPSPGREKPAHQKRKNILEKPRFDKIQVNEEILQKIKSLLHSGRSMRTISHILGHSYSYTHKITSGALQYISTKDYDMLMKIEAESSINV